MGRKYKPIKHHSTLDLWYTSAPDGSNVRYAPRTVTDEAGAWKWLLGEQAKDEAEKQRLISKSKNLDDENARNRAERGEVDRTLAHRHGVTSLPPAPSVPENLTTCWQFYEQVKNEAGRKKETIRDHRTRWERFVKVAGNVSISALEEDMFIQWARYLQRRKFESNKARRDHFGTVKQVLTLCRRTAPFRKSFPADLFEWLSSTVPSGKALTYKAPPSNRQALPPEVFHQLIQICELWEKELVPPKSHDPKRNAARSHALERRKRGAQAKVILSIAINGALDNIDVGRLKWENLHLDADIPWLELPRAKVQWTGNNIVRKVPLLPSVTALLRKMSRKGSHVFRTTRGEQFTSHRVGELWEVLCSAAKVDHSIHHYKHIRNVAPTLRQRYHLQQELADYILGHVPSRTTDMYEQEPDHLWLIPLVNLIGKDYFHGEKVK